MAATALMDDIDITNEVELGRLDDELYEVVDGQRIEKPPMSVYSVRIGSRLFRKLGTFTDDRDLGETVGEMLFRLPMPGETHRNRRPDVAYVSFARWPSNRPVPPKENAWDVVPDLAAEVISPSDFAEASLHKVLEYFQSGVRLVWVVYPEERQVYVYDSPTQIRILTPIDILDGGTVLPGFELRLDRLFDPITPPSEPS